MGILIVIMGIYDKKLKFEPIVGSKIFRPLYKYVLLRSKLLNNSTNIMSAYYSQQAMPQQQEMPQQYEINGAMYNYINVNGEMVLVPVESTMSQNGYPTQGMSQNGYPTQGMYQNGYPTQGMSQNGYPTQGMSQNGYPTQGMSQNGYHAMDMTQNRYPVRMNGDSNDRNSRHVRFSNSTNAGRPTPAPNGYHAPISSNTSSASRTSSTSRASRTSRASNEKTTLEKIRKDLEIRERELRKKEDEFKAEKEMEKKKKDADAKKAVITSTATTIPSLSVADCLPKVQNRWNGPDYDKEYVEPVNISNLTQQQIDDLHSGKYGQVGINPNSGNIVANRANGGMYPVTSGDFERLGGSGVPGYYGEQPEMRAQFGGGALYLR